MSELPKLNFPPIKLRAREGTVGTEVWCDVRAMWLVLTPEEWVRRHLVAFLVSHCAAHAGRVVEEYPVELNSQSLRADVVVVGDDGRPLLLAECKAPSIVVDREVFAQALRYNSVLRARYVVLTNGLKHLCFEYEGGEYRTMESFPSI